MKQGREGAGGAQKGDASKSITPRRATVSHGGLSQARGGAGKKKGRIDQRRKGGGSEDG